MSSVGVVEAPGLGITELPSVRSAAAVEASGEDISDSGWRDVAMAYELREEGGFLKFVFSGTFTNADLSQAADALAEFEASCDVVPHRSADLRPVTRLEIDFPGVFTLAEARRRVRLPNPIKTAIIASDIAHFGFARMFQTLNNHPQIVIAIFGDDEPALQWLKAPDLRPPDVPWLPRPLGIDRDPEL